MSEKIEDFYLKEIYVKLSKENLIPYVLLNQYGNISDVFALQNNKTMDQKVLSLNLKQLSKDKFIGSQMFLKVLYIKDKNNKSIGVDLFIDFLKNNPELQKYFLKHFSYNMRSNYKIIIDSLAINKEDTLRLINSFSIKDFNIELLSPEELIFYLEEKNISVKKIDDFIYSFYKARVNQLKPVAIASSIRSFLLNRYNEDESKLKKYFPFMPLLESYFNNEKLNVFIEDYKYSIVLKINIIDLIKLLALEKWSVGDYEWNFKILIGGIASAYNIEEYDTSTKTVLFNNKEQKILKINMFHNDEDFNVEIIKREIILFTKFIKENKDFKITPSTIKTWCLQNKLENRLENTKNKFVNVSKIKI